MPTKSQSRTAAEEKARKQERARARRKASKINATLESLYKPLDEWDEEELARGRPRGIDGNFNGPAPKWVQRSVHEEAIRRFTDMAQADLRGIVPKAIKMVEDMILSTERDEKGKPVIPPSVQLQAAMWVVEHLVGKPTQRIEADISVRLQGILATALVQPGEDGMIPAIDVQSWVEDEDEDKVGE